MLITEVWRQFERKDKLAQTLEALESMPSLVPTAGFLSHLIRPFTVSACPPHSWGTGQDHELFGDWKGILGKPLLHIRTGEGEQLWGRMEKRQEVKGRKLRAP